MAAPPSYNDATKTGYDTQYGQPMNNAQYGQQPMPQTGFAPPPPAAGYQPQPQQQQQAGFHTEVDSTSTESTEVPVADPDGADEFAGNSFSNKAVRRRFIRKVYLILTAQLLFTVGVVALFLFVDSLKSFVRGPGFWLYYVAYAVFLVTYIALVCCPNVRRKWPGNFICLAVFTAAFSFMLGTISSYHKIESILIAAAITTFVCVGVTIFAIQTKIDFTMCSSLIFGLLLVLLLFGLSLIFVFAFVPVDSRTYYILRCVYGGLGALVFTLFLIFDTQLLFGKHKHKLDPEEHVFGALQLYLDVVYIFIFILSMFGGKN